MRILAQGLVLTTLLAGCTAHDAGQSPPQAAVPVANATDATPQEPAHSPVPAFHGGGVGWRIDLQADRGARHTARLQHGGQWTNATLRLVSATPASDPASLGFEGTLFAPAGDTPLRLTIRRADCKDGRGVLRMQTVLVTVQGHPPLRGCGEITPY